MLGHRITKGDIVPVCGHVKYSPAWEMFTYVYVESHHKTCNGIVGGHGCHGDVGEYLWKVCCHQEMCEYVQDNTWCSSVHTPSFELSTTHKILFIPSGPYDVTDISDWCSKVFDSCHSELCTQCM